MNPVMQAVGVTKLYPGTVALKDVDFDVFPGKVNVLIGENGAGKSTLMKILAGIEKPSEGKVLLEGTEVHFQNTREASAMGVGIIHQELNLFPEMKVADNMFAGKEMSHYGCVDRKAQVKRAAEVLEASDDLALAVYKVVGNDDIVSGRDQLKHRMRADVAGAARYENRHGLQLLSLSIL